LSGKRFEGFGKAAGVPSHLIGSWLTILFGLAVVSVAPLSGAQSRPGQHGTRRLSADRL
jgi:hypothetical protein